MKVVHRDKREGVVKLRPETLDDLWHLHNLVEEGDLVTMATYRTAEESTDKIRSEKTEKKKMRLTLKVERVEFAEFSDRLRILGVITEGPQDLGSHHTFNVEAEGFDDLKITKPDGFRAHHWDRIDEAVEAARRPLVTIVSMDDEEATVAVLRQYGVQTAATVKGRAGGKQYEDQTGDPKKDYFGEVLGVVRRTRQKGTPLVVVGPGFTREEFMEFAKEREPDVVADAVTEGTGQAGGVGVQEALKRGIVERIQRDQQLAVDTRLVEELMGMIAQGGLVTYGRDDVDQALAAGAVELLVITDEMLRTRAGEDRLVKAQQSGAATHVVAATHEAGRQLASMGGMVARLRFQLN